MIASYDPWIVGLSVVIAVVASYTALDLASRVTAVQGRAATLWMLGGAFSMGLGIWSMHFVGMLAYHLPIALAYDVPVTLLSMVPAIASSALALWVIRRRKKDFRTLIPGGVCMGLGIVIMHYTGMAAMRMQPAIEYDPALFALSVVIAIVAATAALWIAGLLPSAGARTALVYRKLGGAAVMGLAISGMHYTGMAAATVKLGSVCLVTPYGVATQWLAVFVGMGAFGILAGTLLVSLFDARLAWQAQVMLGELRHAEAFLSSIVDNMPNMLFVKDARDLRFVRFNKAGEALTGYNHAELIGRNDHDVFPKAQADLSVASDRAALRHPDQVRTEEERLTRRDGDTRIMRTKKLPILDGDGRPRYLLGISEDITERKRDEEGLRIAASAFENMAEGVVVLDAARRIVSVNKAFVAITGYAAEEVLGTDSALLRSGAHGESFYDALWRAIGETGGWQGEMVRRRRSGALFPAFCSISAVRDESGGIKNYVCVFHDISSSKEYEERLEFLAHHDALTRLPNRVRFRESFKQALARSRRTRKAVAVLFIDLDHFKTINDSLGHHAGDRLLQEVAARLGECVRESDVVARFGGDEFAVLIDELDASQDVAKVAASILSALGRPFEIDAHQVASSGSIGISCYPDDGGDDETLLKNADTAMYRAKSEGRNAYRFFSPEMNARALEALVMTNELRLAVQRGEFVLHFQPRHNLRSGAITGLEALVRWRHPQRGLIAPGQFIPLAEETGLIAPLGEWVLRAACEQLASWRAGGLPDLRMAVNLSPRQFAQADLTGRIGAILSEFGLDGAGLELEITEGVVMQDPEKSVRMLRELKAMGIAIAIDDFGTGFSSMGYLKRFPLDQLKIDRTFVREIDVNPADVAIVKAIVALARGLGLAVVAEGVENRAQRDALRRCGCDEAQGFFYGKPCPAQEIELRLPGRPAAATA